MPDDIITLYNQDFFDAQSRESLQSARVVLRELFRHVRPQSVVDIGCGIGTWLRAAEDLGVVDRLGVDGDYVDRGALMLPGERFLPVDLAQPGLTSAVAERGRARFDLVMCLEVAEHLPFERSEALVSDLCQLGDLVLFSAAVPFQHGTGHINEQWPEFWATLFRARGYACFDLLRPTLWAHPDVNWWYAQNTLVFAKEGSEAYAQLPATSTVGTSALSLVHPEAWLSGLLNVWHRHRAAAREEEVEDFRTLLRAWTDGALQTPPLRAVERARASPPGERSVFPFTRTDVDEPERFMAEAEVLRAEIGDARQRCDGLLEELKQARDAQSSTRTELAALQAHAATLQAANTTLRSQIAQYEVKLGEATDKTNEIVRLHQALVRAEAEIADGRMARAQIASLLASTSWRLTRPLRVLRRAFDRLRKRI
jgi:SAM-dependent methyltransferase